MSNAIKFDTKHAMFHGYFEGDPIYGGHLGNDVIEKKAPMKRFYFCSKYSLHSLRSQNQSIVEPE